MRRRVVVIGGGAAGIFTAYEFAKRDSACDVKVLEWRSRVGGHTRGQDWEYEDGSIHIDCGAQFFYEHNEPDYCQLLDDEGFFGPDGQITHHAVGMTVHDATAEEIVFFVPSNLLSLAFAYLHQLEHFRRLKRFTDEAQSLYRSGDWEIPFGAWLDGLNVGGGAEEQREFKSNIVRPLMYQFGLVPPDQIDSLSALFVIYFYVDSLPRKRETPRRDIPSAGSEKLFKLYCLRKGMDGVLDELVARHSLDVERNSRVTGLEAIGEGWRIKAEDGRSWDAEEVVFATNPMRTLQILEGTPGLGELRAVLEKMPYVSVPVHIQAGEPSYMPPRKFQWELSNVGFRRNSSGRMTHSMLAIWFGPVREERIGAAFFKAWGSPELHPPDAPKVATQVHELMVGTPAFIAARTRLRKELQGRQHLWFAGGYIREYDSQNASLRAARDVVDKIERAYSVAALPPAPGLPELHELRSTFETSPLFDWP